MPDITSADGIDSFLTAWAAAELAGDRDRLATLLTDDFVGIGPIGFVLTKPEWINRHEQLRYEAFTVTEVDIRRYGDVAVVIARDNQQGTAFGHPVPEAARATHVLVRQDDSWRLAALHLSFLAGTPGSPPAPGAPGR
jgi:ketosteroid isomerase-like protein